MRNKIRSFIAFLHSSKKTVLLILVVAIASIAITTTIFILLNRIDRLRVPSLGTMKTIGVEAYWDPNRENKTETIDWGTIWPGSSKNVMIYIRSVSNFKATLNLNTTNWNPANISDYISLSWSYNGTPLDPSETIQVTLTLSASSSDSFVQYLIANDVKDFSFDIVIVASG
jgi:hypothetical protein